MKKLIFICLLFIPLVSQCMDHVDMPPQPSPRPPLHPDQPNAQPLIYPHFNMTPEQWQSAATAALLAKSYTDCITWGNKLGWYVAGALGIITPIISTIVNRKHGGSALRGLGLGIASCGAAIMLSKAATWLWGRSTAHTCSWIMDKYAEHWAERERQPLSLEFNGQRYGLIQALQEVPDKAERLGLRRNYPAYSTEMKALEAIVNRADQIRVQRNARIIIPARIQPNPIFNLTEEQKELIRASIEPAKRYAALIRTDNQEEADQILNQIYERAIECRRRNPRVIISVNNVDYNFFEALELFPEAAGRELHPELAKNCDREFRIAIRCCIASTIERPEPEPEPVALVGRTRPPEPEPAVVKID